MVEVVEIVQCLMMNIYRIKMYIECRVTGRQDTAAKSFTIPTCEFLFECKEAEVEIRDSTDLTVRRRLEMEGATSVSVTTESWSGNNKGKLGLVAVKNQKIVGQDTHTLQRIHGELYNFLQSDIIINLKQCVLFLFLLIIISFSTQ